MQAEEQVPSPGIKYRSKVDAWLAVVLVGAFLLTLIVLLFDVVLAGSFATSWWTGVFDVVIWGGVLSLLFPLYDEITPSTWLDFDHVQVASGFIVGKGEREIVQSGERFFASFGMPGQMGEKIGTI